jgi:Transcriptional Coactivator p15 (PC4)
MNSPVISEPITIAEFWVSRHGESIRVVLRKFEGQVLVDIRRYCTGAEGRLLPTSKGISVSVRKLPELVTGLRKALATAAALGLIKSERQPLLGALDEAER